MFLVTEKARLDLSPMLVFDFPKREGRATAERRLMLFYGIDSRGRGLDMDVLGAPSPEPLRSIWHSASALGVFELFARGDWVEGEAPNLRGRTALLARLLARVQAHRESGPKVPIVLAEEPGRGKTALLAAMSRTWRAAGMTVAAYAPRHARSPGLAGLRDALQGVEGNEKRKGNEKQPLLADIRKLALETMRHLGSRIIVLDGLDECANVEEFARAALALAEDGHTVVVGCRPSVLTRLPDAIRLLQGDESLRFAESNFVSWIRDEVPTDVARKLDEKRGQKWLQQTFERSEGLALYVSVIVQRLGDGSLQPQGTPPTLDEEWDRMLSNAGALDDSGRLAPLLLVGICQMPSPSWHEQKILAAFLDADPALSKPLIRDFLDAKGQPFHELLREFVLKTRRLDHTRKVARERWLASAFAHPMRGWTDLPQLAQTLGAHEDGWSRLVEGGAFLPWLSRECFVHTKWINTLAAWAHLADSHVPAELAEWLAIFRECADCDWATSTNPRRTKTPHSDWFAGSTADFILDRVYERPVHSALARRALGSLTEPDSYRPCRRVNAASALPVRFEFNHEVIATGIGNAGKYLATLGPNGELSVDHIPTGFGHLYSFATGVVAELVWVAVSDKLQSVAIGHADEIVVVYFAEQPPRVERHEWRGDGRVVIDRSTQLVEGPFGLPHGLLAYLECNPSAGAVSDDAEGHVVEYESNVKGFYRQPSVDLTAHRTEDDIRVVEVYKGSNRNPRSDHWFDSDKLLAVDGHVARFGVKELTVHDSEGATKFTAEFKTGMVRPPDGPFHFASYDNKKLLRIMCDGDGVRLDEVATFVLGEERDAEGGYRMVPRKSPEQRIVWVDPDGVESAPRWPSSPVSTLRCEVENDNHLLVRDASGKVVADWWGRIALYNPVMLRADRVAVLEDDELVVLSIDLPS